MFRTTKSNFSGNSLDFSSHNSDSIYLASVLSIAFIMLSALSLYILNTTTTHADTSATASVTVPSACTLTGTITSGNAHSTTMVAGTFEEDIGTTNLKAICNDPDGLDIYAVGYSSNTLGNTNLVGDNGLNIATGLNTSSSTGNGNSNWAMKLFFPASTDPNANTVYQPNILSDTNGSYAEYHVIPATSTKVASFNAVTDTTVGSNLNTTYRIYLEQNQPAGTYIGQVKYTITHPNTSFSLYMQDFTPEMCNTLGTAVTKTVTLYDKRDDNSYTVTYINGQCWMTQNLRITGVIPAEGSNFSGADVDVSESLTTGLSYNAPKSLVGVDNNGDPTVWYNFAAATAGTIVGNSNTNNAVQDICPSGWKLPSGPNSVSGTDFNRLIGNDNGEWQDLTESFIQFNPVGSGNYWSGLENTESGLWWSATADTNTAHEGYYGRRYSIWYNSSTNQIFGSNYPLRAHGQSIRCVLQPTMQDATSSSLSTLMPNDGDATSLIDSRDNNSYTVRRINNQYWMVDNLRLTGTVSASKSNFTGSDFNVSQYSLDAADASYTDHCDSTNGLDYACAKDSGSKQVGVRYNYVAATAGTITGNSNSATATEDICPAGWHLPSGPNTTQGTDFNKIFGNTDPGWQDPTGTGLDKFDTVIGGYLLNGEFKWVNYGFWWSTTPGGSDENLYRLLLYYYGNNGKFKGDTESTTGRACGYFVRCIHD